VRLFSKILRVVGLALESTLVLDRLDGASRLTTPIARDHGVLGYVARGAGIESWAARTGASLA
jgi:Ni,Fe-hydrogenase III large subunit